jgi:hypothetical protein
VHDDGVGKVEWEKDGNGLLDLVLAGVCCIDTKHSRVTFQFALVGGSQLAGDHEGDRAPGLREVEGSREPRYETLEPESRYAVGGDEDEVMGPLSAACGGLKVEFRAGDGEGLWQALVAAAFKDGHDTIKGRWH